MVLHVGALSDGSSYRTGSQKILLVEDSRMFSAVLSHRFETELGLAVTHCASLKMLNEALADGGRGFTMAVIDLNLPDAAYGEALDVAVKHQIPSIVFTASFDTATRNRIMERSVVDYSARHHQSDDTRTGCR